MNKIKKWLDAVLRVKPFFIDNNNTIKTLYKKIEKIQIYHERTETN